MEFSKPAILQDGQAMYDTGEGNPLLLLPYPQGFGGAPIAQGALVAVFREQGLRVVRYDPPGAFHYTRPAQVSMPEMLGCAQETLHTLNLQCPLHSMGGLCAIAMKLAHQEWVKKLVLIGALSGGSAISRAKGMPWGSWLTGLDRGVVTQSIETVETTLEDVFNSLAHG
jgi:pimeloyl-ACP methyl ester carboxylesterase